MPNRITNYLKHKLRLSGDPYAKKSYSQTGEDLIIQHIFRVLGVKKPSYVDIGAHAPRLLSNTALFYSLGSSGVNVEPDPTLFAELARVRTRDTNLNIAIADVAGEADFYIMSGSAMNTMSKNEADRLVAEGLFSIREVCRVKTDTINHVFEKHCDAKPPDLMSLDVEGMELAILQSLDYARFAPTVICAETISYSVTKIGVRDKDIPDFLATKGYVVYADTYHNTIFVREDAFSR